MTCSRCQGFITVEGCIDAEDDGLGQRWTTAWHCVSCGQASDPATRSDSRTPRCLVRAVEPHGFSLLRRSNFGYQGRAAVVSPTSAKASVGRRSFSEGGCVGG
jgi:hypothetical protein